MLFSLNAADLLASNLSGLSLGYSTGQMRFTYDQTVDSTKTHFENKGQLERYLLGYLIDISPFEASLNLQYEITTWELASYNGNNLSESKSYDSYAPILSGKISYKANYYFYLYFEYSHILYSVHKIEYSDEASTILHNKGHEKTVGIEVPLYKKIRFFFDYSQIEMTQEMKVYKNNGFNMTPNQVLSGYETELFLLGIMLTPFL